MGKLQVQKHVVLLEVQPHLRAVQAAIQVEAESRWNQDFRFPGC